ncbi:MAG: undecaprenyldiphospho-muramoylpentapeptide beta-N-acetylglucosaminyltransferase [Clostridiales bacterium]|jgi:UDP-N-acetylglucosamine--N-acetylmuramyl-(pentapeptide) pyrophosphoryl-undecaprenol N-acetylglucosamine transferase|nr:undecaprenyldiphospho-muramoylpentapeptide beta-N-acetylglucosaminyltransferase [Clostridiales bacterium]
MVLKIKIILTGGGSAGHVTPNLALVKYLRNENFEIFYIGSYNGIEKELCEKNKINYYSIATGKLRRYLSIKNIIDIKNIFLGIKQANDIVKKIKPDVLFSKGGFVSVPVVIACKINKVPIVIHESDVSPGLANKISCILANKICCSFEETKKYIKKSIVTGPPIRDKLFFGDKEKARIKLNFDKRPVILVIGGSLGSLTLNSIVRKILYKLDNFQVIHICGKNNLKKINLKNYREFGYVDQELSDFFSLADIVISRSGSNAIFEILYLKKPNILIPLSKKASRGDQILNAKIFEEKNFSRVIFEEELSDQKLLDEITYLYKNKDKYIKTMTEKSGKNDSCETILRIIKNLVLNK